MTKVCLRCNEAKDISSFGKDSRTKAGIASSCKRCLSARDKVRNKHGRGVRSRYNISLSDYDRILAEQDGRCAVCKTDKPVGKGASRFSVDHDHACCPGKKSCGKCVRGLLCRLCNIGIGALRDDISVLAHAIEYLSSRSR